MGIRLCGFCGLRRGIVGLSSTRDCWCPYSTIGVRETGENRLLLLLLLLLTISSGTFISYTTIPRRGGDQNSQVEYTERYEPTMRGIVVLVLTKSVG